MNSSVILDTKTGKYLQTCYINTFVSREDGNITPRNIGKYGYIPPHHISVEGDIPSYLRHNPTHDLQKFGIFDELFICRNSRNSQEQYNSFINKIYAEISAGFNMINLLKPTGHAIHQKFKIQQLYFLPTLYLCVLYLSENKQRLVPLTA